MRVFVFGSTIGVAAGSSVLSWRLGAVGHQPMPELAGHAVVWRQADVADCAAIEAAIGAGEAAYGLVECLVNSAGTAYARQFDLVEPEIYAREIDTNLLGVLNCTRAVLSSVASRKSGTIINISSVSDRKTAPVALAYAASKWAFSESLREAQSKNNNVRRVPLSASEKHQIETFGVIQFAANAALLLTLERRGALRPACFCTAAQWPASSGS